MSSAEEAMSSAEEAMSSAEEAMSSAEGAMSSAEGAMSGGAAVDTAQIDVYVCKGTSGEIVRARISPDDRVEEALPLIADQIHYYTADYEKIGLYNMTQDFEYLMDDRFADRGTRHGDLLFMIDGAACHK